MAGEWDLLRRCFVLRIAGSAIAAEWKSQTTTFPLRSEITQTPAAFPLSHSLGDCQRLLTTRRLIY